MPESESSCQLYPLSNRILAVPKSELESHTNLTNTKSTLLSSCRICLSSIFDPAYLTCGHRFCEKCLNTYWQVRDKPDFIVCPLCRANAFNVDFAKKEELNSTQDFRKMFDADNVDLVSHTNVIENRCTFFCLKISILMPLIYFLAKILKPPLLSLYSFISDLALTLLYFI